MKTALLGTDRSELSQLLQTQLEQLGVDPSLTDSEAILEATVLVSRMRRAGRILTVWNKPLPNLELAEGERNSSPALARFFEKLMEDDDDRLLGQMMEKMKAKQVVLPGSMLPMLLQKATGNTDFAAMLIPVLGSRGKWLASQHPEWRLLVLSSENFSWETGKHAERLALLRYWRHEDPVVGLHLLESTWNEETTAHQKTFLKCLQINLSLADEDFLEGALDSRRKEVRKTAAELLACVSDSALVKRMFVRAKQFLALKGKEGRGKISVELPEAPDKALLRDGLDNKKQWHQGGLKASRLWQILSVIPPQYWATHFNCPVKELLSIYVRSEWSELLVQSAIDACLRHQDDEWTEALLNFWMENYSKQRWANLQVDGLFPLLHPLSFERIVAKALRKNVAVPEEDDPLIDLLSIPKMEWGDELSQKILVAIRGWIGDDQMRYWGGWYLKSVLKNAAYCANPLLYERTRRAWNNAGPVWTSWENDEEDFFEVYQKRRRIVELLK